MHFLWYKGVGKGFFFLQDRNVDSSVESQKIMGRYQPSLGRDRVGEKGCSPCARWFRAATLLIFSKPSYLLKMLAKF